LALLLLLPPARITKEPVLQHALLAVRGALDPLPDPLGQRDPIPQPASALIERLA
jgi:hypothetical protein